MSAFYKMKQYGFAPTYKCIGVEAGIAQTLQYFFFYW